MKTAEEKALNLRNFMLKEFPTDRYMDCPIDKRHWETIQEYADQFAKQEVAIAVAKRDEEIREWIKKNSHFIMPAFKGPKFAVLSEELETFLSTPTSAPTEPTKVDLSESLITCSDCGAIIQYHIIYGHTYCKECGSYGTAENKQSNSTIKVSELNEWLNEHGSAWIDPLDLVRFINSKR